MRRSLLLISPAILAAAFLFTAFGSGDNSDYPGGSPGGYSGSPGDGHNCSISSCHGGSATNVTGWITSNVPADGYTPGATYTITATATGSGKKGFEISPQSVSGSLLGVLTHGSGNKLCNGNKAVTHSSSVSGSSATWTFSWTAPAAGTGSVTFYGAFAVTEPVTKLSTMVVNEATSLPLTATATAMPSTICAGQSSQLGVNVSGGNPPYTYLWTSDPAGFTSNLQSPAVSPAGTTIYSVQVGDGTSFVDSPVTVTVMPEPLANAGNDTIVCADVVSVPIYGIASNYASVAWTTSGDGTFSTTSALSSIYFPGTADRNSGSVDLTLTVSPVSPCETPVSSVRHFQLIVCEGIYGSSRNICDIVLSPNPTNGLIYITYRGVKDNDSKVTVFTNQGKQVLTQTASGTSMSSGVLDLSAFTKGIYFVKVQTNDEVKIQKVILQ